MDHTEEAPVSAAHAAADELAAEGAHVHLVSDGEAACHSGHCAGTEVTIR